MKSIFLSVAILIFYNAKSQTALVTKSQSEPVKNKSNRIVLHFKDTSGLFVKLAKILIDRGYEIDSKDRELGTLSTKPGNAPGGYSHKHEVKSVFRDSTIMIWGASYSGGYKFDTFYTGKKRKNIVDMSWVELMAIGEMLKPDSITYLIQ